MKKLIEGNKDNLIISIDNNDGVSYKFTYNEGATFKWNNFRNKSLVNKETKESEKYKDLILMRDANDPTILYLYPSRIVDLENVYNQYALKNWLFEDSADYQIMVDSDNRNAITTKLPEEVKDIKNAVLAIANYLIVNEGDKSFMQKKIAATEELRKVILALQAGNPVEKSTLKEKTIVDYRSSTLPILPLGTVTDQHQQSMNLNNQEYNPYTQAYVQADPTMYQGGYQLQTSVVSNPTNSLGMFKKKF